MKKVVTSIAMLMISTNALAQGQSNGGPSLSANVGAATQAMVQSAGSPILAQRPSQQTAQIPAGYEIIVTPMTDFTSKGTKVGHTFTVQTVYDVMLDGYLVIPRGTLGQGRVTWRTGKGVFGKSAKMEVTFDWIDVGGRRIGLSGKHRQDGAGSTAATGGVALVGLATGVGILGGLFITGKSANIGRGTQMTAYTMEAIPVAIPSDNQSSGIPAMEKAPLPVSQR